MTVAEEFATDTNVSNSWKTVYDKVLKLEEEYAESGDIENVNHCIRLQNLMQYFKEELQEGYNNGWIPCSERLPEIAGYPVLATLENKFGQIRVARIFTSYDLKPFWHCNNPEFDLNVWKVIAWQPLPEPYKGEKA